MKIFFIIFIFLLINFVIATEYNVPLAAYSVYATDLDLDGDNDIIVGHNYNSETEWSGISVLINKYNGSFCVKKTYFLYGWQPDVQAVNLDSINNPEIIAKSYSLNGEEEYISVIYNLSVKDSFLLGKSKGVEYIATGDFNGDGDIDIVVASNHGQFWGVMYNDGNGGLFEPEYFSKEYYPLDIVCGDLNGDSLDDVVVAGYNELCLSTGSGFNCSRLASSEQQLRIVDIDNDGDYDIVGLQNWYLIGHTGITIYENSPADTLITHEQFLFQPALSYFEVACINNDSLPDLVCTCNNGIYILTNLGNYQFSEPEYVYVRDYGQYLNKSYCADFDNNGSTDIVTIRYLHAELPYNLNILFNDGNGNFQANPVSIETSVIAPKQFRLTNYPNPFNSVTHIEFNLKTPQNLSLNIYDVNGCLIKEIIKDKQYASGVHSIKWNGKNQCGKEVSSGIYFYVLSTNEGSFSGKMLLTK